MERGHAAAQAALERYRSVERDCERMLDAARVDDWEGVGEIAAGIRTLVAAIRLEVANAEPAGRDRSEKFRILSNIVRLDAQIRHLANPWQQRIDTMLGHRSVAGRGNPLAA